MGASTKIEWCSATWNPVRGCSRTSPGCGGANHKGGCYAEKIAARFSAPGQPFHGFAERTPHGGRWTGRLALIDELLDLPLRWKRPRRIFVNSMSDLFHEALPFEDIDRVFEVMALAHQHTFQILTKRADRMLEYFGPSPELDGFTRDVLVEGGAQKLSHERTGEDPSMWLAVHWPLPNVWLGVSVEDQARADERIPHLLATPAAVRFISAEPLLAPVDLTSLSSDNHAPSQNWKIIDGLRGRTLRREGAAIEDGPKIDWVIVGGESGPNARPMHPAWARSLRDQCAAAGAPFFFKQWGEWAPGLNDLDRISIYLRADGERVEEGDAGYSESEVMWRVGKAKAGRLLDGREWSEFPEATCR